MLVAVESPTPHKIAAPTAAESRFHRFCAGATELRATAVRAGIHAGVADLGLATSSDLSEPFAAVWHEVLVQEVRPVLARVLQDADDPRRVVDRVEHGDLDGVLAGLPGLGQNDPLSLFRPHRRHPRTGRTPS